MTPRTVALTLFLTAPALATTYTDEAAFRAAAGAYAVENFDAFPNSNFFQLTGLPALNITFDPLSLSAGAVYPNVENTSVGGFAHSGTQILGNNDANFLPAEGNAQIRPTPGLAIYAIGYWNVGQDDRTTLFAYDANDVLIESITTPDVAGNLSFQGIVTTTPILRAVISEFTGNGWWTIDDLHITTGAIPEPAAAAVLFPTAILARPRRRSHN